MQRLIDLLAAYPHPMTHAEHIPDIMVASITSDSRQVKKNSVFVALKGSHADGERFIEDAVARGASAIIASKDAILPPLPTHVFPVIVDSARLALSLMAARFFNKQPKFICAVTGTDGKTSTTFFARQLWEMLGIKAASLGTLGLIGEGGQVLTAGSHTTPDPVSLHQSLANLADYGYTHLAMEASSHGLDQHRMDGVVIEAAAFTNLTRDHLDYHKTMEEYFNAKARLFKDVLAEKGIAVMNVEDAHVAELVKIVSKRGCQVIEFGEEARHIRILDIEPLPHGQRANLMVWGKPHQLVTPLVGSFQIYNMLCAAGLVIASGFDIGKTLSLLPQLKGVRGRLEHIGMHQGASIFIDYAHTPTALANVLETLRPHTQGRLHVVFGCGGDRDKGKRPEMGGVAASLADVVIVTDDNPRTEDAHAIRQQVLAACPDAVEIADRREAIHTAMQQLGQGDILLVAGKGHEVVQIIGDQQLAFDDAEVIRERLVP